MRISVFGLGYVGAVSAACLAASGHRVIGVDTNLVKVNLINGGVAPIVEDRLEAMIGEAVQSGRLRAISSVDEAILESDLSLICVGTPSRPNGDLDLSFVCRVAEDIGRALRRKSAYHVVVARSTMLPGSMRNIVIPMMEDAATKRAGEAFGVCVNPEFLRESTAVSDYYHPPKIVIGESDPLAGDVLLELYRDLEAPIIRTSLEVAEMVKYADNSWHGLKVAFANEIGSISKALNISGQHVMDIFCMDRKLNLSDRYLSPGFSFGGSCLPKDLRALTFRARSLDLEVPVMNSILPSNRRHLERGIAMITSKGKCKIGVLGIAFKSGTDDLRESPIVELIEYLLGKGYDLRVFDTNVNVAALTGGNLDYLRNHVPHITQLMLDTVEGVIEFADTLVIGNAAPEFLDQLAKIGPDKSVVDLTHAKDGLVGGDYEGICW